MGLKGKQIKVEHIFVQGNEEELNKFTEGKRNSGWNYMDCKVILADWHNRVFTILYIFEKEVKDLE